MRNQIRNTIKLFSDALDPTNEVENDLSYNIIPVVLAVVGVVLVIIALII